MKRQGKTNSELYWKQVASKRRKQIVDANLKVRVPYIYIYIPLFFVIHVSYTMKILKMLQHK